jgi:hypothetical protein
MTLQWNIYKLWSIYLVEIYSKHLQIYNLLKLIQKELENLNGSKPLKIELLI